MALTWIYLHQMMGVADKGGTCPHGRRIRVVQVVRVVVVPLQMAVHNVRIVALVHYKNMSTMAGLARAKNLRFKATSVRKIM
jgi:hypothetical protein